VKPSDAAMALSLKETIRSGENTRVEFKKTLSKLEKIAKTLVSFANTKGGTLLIGIQDDKQIIGISDAEEELYMLEQANLFYCNPPVEFSTSEELVSGKSVLVIEIKESQNKPHRSLSGNGDWLLYVRTEDQCMVASDLVAKAFEFQKYEREAMVRSKSETNNEKALFGFLDRKRRITLKDYAKLINVSKRRAYSILIRLTLSGKLFMHDLEQTLFFTRA